MKKFLIIICFILILSTTAFADNEELRSSLPDDAQLLLNGDNLSAEDSQNSLSKIFGQFKEKIKEAANPAISRAVSLVLVSVICSVFTVFGDEKGSEYVSLCGCAAVCMICISDFGSYIKIGTETINQISDFSKSMLPAICAAMASCGMAGAAAAKYASTALFMDVLITIAQKLILPLIYAYLALIIASAVFNNKGLAGITKLIKWACTAFLTLMALCFTSYLTLSSAIAGSSDAVTMKLAKSALSSTLPVVGSIMSDAASSVVAGAEMLKNSIGVFGMLGVLAICAAPFAVIGINFLMYKASAAGAAAFGNSSVSSLIDGIGTAFGMILALVGSISIILFISILSCVRMVSGA